MKHCLYLLAATLLLASYAAHAETRNLSGRLGVGFTNQLVTNSSGSTLPMISAKYHMSKSSAASLGIGFDTQSANSTVGAGLKYYQNLFLEENLIFYTGLGIGLVSRNGTKFQASAFLGPEFFFSGLPSLGFSIEAGIRGDSYSGSFAIKTISDSFITGGIHFYF